VAADYPRGLYAPLAKYSLAAGHSYFDPPKYLEIEDPAAEAEAWPRFLTEHPGHPGSDDAAYRLGRALERLGRHREAAVWLARSASLPDGEFVWKGPLRSLWVLDALASEEDLDALAAKGNPSSLRERAALSRGIRALRRDAFGEALARLRAFAEEFPASRWKAPAEQRAKDLEEVLVPLAGRAAGPDGDDEALYEIGRYFYHRLLSLYNPAWENQRVKYMSYEVTCLGRTHAFDAPAYFESHNNYLKAAAYFDRLWREKPASPRRPAALYSAGTAYFRAATLDAFSVYKRTREELLDESAARYRRLADEHPEDSLAAAARKMIEVVNNLPRQ
jgi:TolA-binding protein